MVNMWMIMPKGEGDRAWYMVCADTELEAREIMSVMYPEVIISYVRQVTSYDKGAWKIR